MLKRLLLALAVATLCVTAQAQQAAPIAPGKSCFTGSVGLTGMISTLGTITPGSGGTNGTYPATLLGGTGTGATANVLISGGVVTSVTVTSPGVGYTSGDTLTASSSAIGGATGFSVPVATTAISGALAGGSVTFYVPNTTTPKSTWKDVGRTTLNTNPVLLDGNGCAPIYGNGSYRQVLKDVLGNTVWDQFAQVVPFSPYWAGTATGSGNAILLADPQFTTTDGQQISFLVGSNNTGATTITPSATGVAIPVFSNSGSGPAALTGGEFVTGNYSTVTYSAAVGGFVLLNPQKVFSQLSFVTDYNPLACTNSSHDDAGAFAAASAAGGVRVPDNKTCYINSTTTISSPIILGNNSKICISSGHFLYVVGQFTSSRQNVFNPTSCLGQVWFFYATPVVYPEWWGGAGNSSTINNTAMNSAVQSLTNSASGTILFDSGTYLFDCSSTVAVTIQGSGGSDLPVSIAGQGMSVTVIRPSTDCHNAIFFFAPKGGAGKGDVHDIGFSSNTPTHATALYWSGLNGGDSGVSAVYNINSFNMGTTIDCDNCNDMKFDWLYINNCYQVCVLFGGGIQDRTSTIPNQHVGIINVNHVFISVNQVATVNCLQVDSGANAMTFHDILVGGCVVGAVITNTYYSTGGHRPEDILFENLRSDVTTTNLLINSCWQCRFNDLYFGRSLSNNVDINAAGIGAGPEEVDGVSFVGGIIRGNNIGGDLIRISSGGNVIVNGVATMYGAPAGAASIHATASSYGLLQVLGNGLGNSFYANQGSVQSYGILLDNQSLKTSNTCGGSGTSTCLGRFMATGNNTCGNATAGIQNNGTNPSGANYYATGNTCP